MTEEEREIVSKLKYKGEPDPRSFKIGSPEYAQAMRDWATLQRICYPKRRPMGDSILDDDKTDELINQI